MKKLLFALIALAALPLLAQEPDIQPPDNWMDLLGNMDTWLGTLAGIAAATVFLGSVVTSLLKITKGWLKQIMAWVVAIAICVAGNLANFGLLAEANVWQTIAYGLGAGLVANGFFNVTIIRAILVALKLEVKKEV
jgi:hypothetical protein